ncbi:hypothetical protein FH972_001723 [Carpinus fangiana]|uniref:Uncharacterized protein n=1 Tax=Carpinus fangiana TaxID=176857 RepID=A0A5N6QCS1_9ROSI|nr:hypothetical protein FH972_001722 [Carpinus fangiana]KAE7997056.1 hypothetical protein FH972_001723 [Carpinus fangiana]
MPLTLHKLEASSHKEVHFTSTTENKPSAGVPKRKWGGFRARPPATAPRTRSQTKSPVFSVGADSFALL